MRSAHSGELIVAAAVAVGQPLVIQPQQVQNGGVQVVMVQLVIDAITT